MSTQGYVSEKLGVAIQCLCGEGPFKTRLASATVSALIRLDSADLDIDLDDDGELADDLAFILQWTKDNVANGELVKEPNELERRELVDKMLHVMLATHGK